VAAANPAIHALVLAQVDAGIERLKQRRG
jgi:hypothetical protein